MNKTKRELLLYRTKKKGSAEQPHGGDQKTKLPRERKHKLMRRKKGGAGRRGGVHVRKKSRAVKKSSSLYL